MSLILPEVLLPTQRGRGDTVGMTHAQFIASLTQQVHAGGAVAALAHLRATRPAFTSVGYHDTAAVFAVWAVDRLVAAGLDDFHVMWHPLTDARSIRSWWDETTLASAAARDGFVPSTLARPGEACPTEPVPSPLLAA
jgi:hypothetical protein